MLYLFTFERCDHCQKWVELGSKANTDKRTFTIIRYKHRYINDFRLEVWKPSEKEKPNS